MRESRTVAFLVSSRTELFRGWSVNALQATAQSLSRAGVWAADTAQHFGSVVSALMGPAVVSAYAFTAWSLAANLGWTDSFLFVSGPLSNWFVWLGIAILTNAASGILRKRTRSDEE